MEKSGQKLSYKGPIVLAVLDGVGLSPRRLSSSGRSSFILSENQVRAVVAKFFEAASCSLPHNIPYLQPQPLLTKISICAIMKK